MQCRDSIDVVGLGLSKASGVLTVPKLPFIVVSTGGAFAVSCIRLDFRIGPFVVVSSSLAQAVCSKASRDTVAWSGGLAGPPFCVERTDAD
jgi:hypothetical protein